MIANGQLVPIDPPKKIPGKRKSPGQTIVVDKPASFVVDSPRGDAVVIDPTSVPQPVEYPTQPTVMWIRRAIDVVVAFGPSTEQSIRSIVGIPSEAWQDVVSRSGLVLQRGLYDLPKGCR